jgi:FkbM family methyltransferase
MEILDKIRRRWYKWTERKVNVPIEQQMPLIRPGTDYGGWIIPDGFLRADAIVYLVGAGEDVSFDLAIADLYGCRVEIIDPTPRAATHVQTLIQHLRQGLNTPLANSPQGVYPPAKPATAELLRFHPVGLWNEKTTLRFFKPQNEAHVSHSFVNLQKTDEYIEVPVCRLSQLMEELGHRRIDLLKIDIEGAEYTVLQTLLEDGLEVDVLCIEYDETAANHLDGQYLDRIENSLNELRKAGYKVVAKEPACRNYTLVHQRVSITG